MSLLRFLAALTLVVSSVIGSAAQGIPGTRAHVLGQAGWDALREGRNQDAADAFSAAVIAEPRDPSLHMGAGLAAYLLGQISSAQQSLLRALTMSPSFTAASLLLGDIHHRNNELDEAVRVYEQALTYAPGDKTVMARLERVREEATLHRGFFQSQGAHFTVMFEGPSDEELSRKVLDVLEAAYWRVGTALLTFPERVIPVVLYTEQQFRDVTRSPGWAAAAYDGRIRVPVRGALTNPEELERVLTHEFTHALVRAWHRVASRRGSTKAWPSCSSRAARHGRIRSWRARSIGCRSTAWRAGSKSCRARRRAWPTHRAAPRCAPSSSKRAPRRW